MFLRQFKYLIAVAEERHFGRAADRCCVTQPSLSSGIKQLELELGVAIFLRGRGQRFLGLTAEGERVAKWARRITAHCDAMKDELDTLKGDLRGSIRIGAMPSMSPVLPTIISMLRDQHPGISADVHFLGIEQLKQGLNKYSLDVGITYLDLEDLGRLNTLPIFPESLSLLVPDTEEFAGRDEIKWQELSNLPLAMLRTTTHERSYIDSVFEQVGKRPKPLVESESILHLMFQVQFSDLVTIIPTHFAKMPGLHNGTRILKLIEPNVSQRVGLVWADGEPVIPMAGALVEIMRKLKKSGDLARVLGDLEIIEQDDIAEMEANYATA